MTSAEPAIETHTATPGRPLAESLTTTPVEPTIETPTSTFDRPLAESLTTTPVEPLVETLVSATRRYRLVDTLANFANHHLGGAIKNYMCRTMLPQVEPIKFPASYRRRIQIRETLFEGRPTYALTPQRAEACAPAMLFLHGGGGMMVPTRMHFETAVRLVELTGRTLYFPMYPLAPKSNAIGACTWMQRYYEYLRTAEQIERCCVIGDSAGANLAAALCHGGIEGMERVVLISPALRIDAPETCLAPCEPQDVLLSCEVIKNIAKYWGSGIDLKDYRINSSFVDYRGFPPTLLVYGAHEMFAHVIPDFIERIQSAGVDLEVYRGEIHCHDWALAGIYFPEAKQMVERIAEFVQGL